MNGRMPLCSSATCRRKESNLEKVLPHTVPLSRTHLQVFLSSAARFLALELEPKRWYRDIWWYRDRWFSGNKTSLSNIFFFQNYYYYSYSTMMNISNSLGVLIAKICVIFRSINKSVSLKLRLSPLDFDWCPPPPWLPELMIVVCPAPEMLDVGEVRIPLRACGGCGTSWLKLMVGTAEEEPPPAFEDADRPRWLPLPPELLRFVLEELPCEWEG